MRMSLLSTAVTLAFTKPVRIKIGIQNLTLAVTVAITAMANPPQFGAHAIDNHLQGGRYGLEGNDEILPAVGRAAVHTANGHDQVQHTQGQPPVVGHGDQVLEFGAADRAHEADLKLAKRGPAAHEQGLQGPEAGEQVHGLLCALAGVQRQGFESRSGAAQCLQHGRQPRSAESVVNVEGEVAQPRRLHGLQGGAEVGATRVAEHPQSLQRKSRHI